MTKLKLLALLLILMLTLSAFTSCFAKKNEGSGNNDSTGDNQQTTEDPTEDCNHFWLDGTCTKCDKPCTHVWSDGVCTNCKESCSHSYSGDKCSVCGKEKEPEACEHSWANGVCSKCQTACTHSWVSGTCGICNTDCNHTWLDSVCSTCGTNCTHSWGDDGICANCGNECEHNFENGSCTVCHKTCAHSWENGVCTVCSKVCEHIFDGNTCTDCGYVRNDPPAECEHEWVNGICTKCEKSCAHKYENGVCTVCNTVCQHVGVWANGTCMLCSYVCPHDSWNKGICNTCAYQCAHGSWTDGKCDTCAYKCTHTWTDGTCSVCGYECSHEAWTNGECNACDKTCSHNNWNEGSCTVCSYECPHDTWTDSNCNTCDYVCTHEAWIDGKCDKCQKQCEHSWMDTGYCSKCGDDCSHNYIPDGHCSICHNPCGHTSWTEGVCDKCGKICPHTDIEYGYCIVCGYFDESSLSCDHAWVDGVCTKCYETCEHHYIDGTCTICGFMPVYLWYEGNARHVPFNYTFANFLSDLGISYDEAMSMGLWRVDCYDDRQYYDINSPEFKFSDYGRNFTVLCETENIPEYVSFDIIFFYWRTTEWGYDDYGNETQIPCDPMLEFFSDKGYLQAGIERHNTLGNFLAEYAPYESYIDTNNFDYYVNGVLLSETSLIGQDAILVAVEKNAKEDLSTRVTVSVDGTDTTKTYSYPCPIYLEYVKELFVKEFKVDTAVYAPTYSSTNESIYFLVYGNVSITYKIMERDRSAYIVNNVNHTNIDRTTYLITELPTVREYLAKLGINPDDYRILTLNDGEITDLDTREFFELYLIEKSKVEEEISIRISLKEDEYNDTFIYGSVTLDSPITLENLTYLEIAGDDGYFFFLPGFYRCYAFIINDELYCPYLAKEDLVFFFYEDCEIEVIPCYPVTVEYYDVLTEENVSETFIFTTRPTGQDIINKLGKDMSSYTPRCNWINYLYEDFLVNVLLDTPCTVSFLPNKVSLDIYITDVFGYEISDMRVADIRMNLADIIADLTSGYEGSFTFILKSPDGTEIELTAGSNVFISYNRNYSEFNYNESVNYTYYTLYAVTNEFCIDVTVDGISLDRILVNKKDGLTIAEILAQNGIEYDIYAWYCNDAHYNYIEISADYVPTTYIRVEGTDTRPYFDVSLDGESYRIRHTSSLTLSEVITLLNEEYGKSISFESYLWYASINYNLVAISDPSTTVVEEGNWGSVTAKTLSTVNVMFFTDFGPLGYYDYVPFNKDSAWETPVIDEGILGYTQGIIKFTGVYEYRDNGAIYDVNSIEDLFALKKEYVELYAKFEIDTDRLYGVYVNDSEVIVINEDSMVVYVPDYISPAYSYTIQMSGMISIQTENGNNYYLDRFSEANKMQDGEFCVIFFDPYGSSYICRTLEEYETKLSFTTFDYATDIYGNSVDNVGTSGLYVVYTEREAEDGT